MNLDFTIFDPKLLAKYGIEKVTKLDGYVTYELVSINSENKFSRFDFSREYILEDDAKAALFLHLKMQQHETVKSRENIPL